jgi:hypothetical protein
LVTHPECGGYIEYKDAAAKGKYSCPFQDTQFQDTQFQDTQFIFLFTPFAMSSSELQLRLALCKRRVDAATVHWIIVVVPAGEIRCTYYHVLGGPTQGTSYTMQIQANKRIDSQGIEETHLITPILAKDLIQVKNAAQGAPLQRCQTWCVAVLAELERKGVVPAGTALQWQGRVEPQVLPQQSGSGSSRASQPANNSASQRSNNASNQPSSGLTEAQAAASGQWYWDVTHKRYRFFNQTTRAWVWQ